MARKRPAKRRRQSQKSVDLTECKIKNHTHSKSCSDASRTDPLTSHPSSDDGTLSENAMSDGAQTAMTSIMDTDEEAVVGAAAVNTATTSEPDTDDQGHDYDNHSVYPRSNYPQVAFEHITEEPWRGSEAHGGSDM